MGGGGFVIYYVIPRELAHKYYKEFKKRFAGVEGVEVIIDRRETDRRSLTEGGGKRVCATGGAAASSGSFPEV